MIFRIELSDGGCARGGRTLEDTHNIMEDLLYQNAGRVAPPTLIASGDDESRLWEVWELPPARAMILGNYSTNPHKDYLKIK